VGLTPALILGQMHHSPMRPSRSAAPEPRSRRGPSIRRRLGRALWPGGPRAWDVQPTTAGPVPLLRYVTQQGIGRLPLVKGQLHGIGHAVASPQRVQFFGMPHEIHHGEAVIEMFLNLVNPRVSHAASFLASLRVFSP
jgi:hypothetical protein